MNYSGYANGYAVTTPTYSTLYTTHTYVTPHVTAPHIDPWHRVVVQNVTLSVLRTVRDALGRARMNVGLVPPVSLELSTEPIVTIAPRHRVARVLARRRLAAPRGLRPVRSRPGARP